MSTKSNKRLTLHIDQKHLVSGTPTAEQMTSIQASATRGLNAMSDRNFIDWLTTMFPEVGTCGELNIGIPFDGATAYRYKYEHVRAVIEAELYKRCGARRITDQMVVVDLVEGLTPTAAMTAFITNFERATKATDKLPDSHVLGEDGPFINREWMDLYCKRYGVTASAAWAVAAKEAAVAMGRDNSDWIRYPDPVNPTRVAFVRAANGHFQ